jgi:hypothetical protein
MIIGNNYYTAFGLFGTLFLMLIGLFATYPAVIAYEKGRSFTKWYIFSFFLLPVAFFAALMIKKYVNAIKFDGSNNAGYHITGNRY